MQVVRHAGKRISLCYAVLVRDIFVAARKETGWNAIVCTLSIFSAANLTMLPVPALFHELTIADKRTLMPTEARFDGLEFTSKTDPNAAVLVVRFVSAVELQINAGCPASSQLYKLDVLGIWMPLVAARIESDLLA